MKRTRGMDLYTGSGGVEVNMAPLIDMVFLLLIFFVSTAVFVEETGVDIERPRAVSARRLERDSILLALTANGEVVYGGRAIGLNSVRGLVAQLLRERNVPVILMADESSRSGKLIELVDECRLAGAKQVNVAARHNSDGQN